MTKLAEQIADAKAHLARLQQQATSATCSDLGHDWHSLGGASAGCCLECSCSVPVHTCRRCGDCDYGDNLEASSIRDRCRASLD